MILRKVDLEDGSIEKGNRPILFDRIDSLSHADAPDAQKNKSADCDTTTETSSLC